MAEYLYHQLNRLGLSPIEPTGDNEQWFLAFIVEGKVIDLFIYNKKGCRIWPVQRISIFEKLFNFFTPLKAEAKGKKILEKIIRNIPQVIDVEWKE